MADTHVVTLVFLINFVHNQNKNVFNLDIPHNIKQTGVLNYNLAVFPFLYLKNIFLCIFHYVYDL